MVINDLEDNILLLKKSYKKLELNTGKFYTKMCENVEGVNYKVEVAGGSVKISYFYDNKNELMRLLIEQRESDLKFLYKVDFGAKNKLSDKLTIEFIDKIGEINAVFKKIISAKKNNSLVELIDLNKNINIEKSKVMEEKRANVIKDVNISIRKNILSISEKITEEELINIINNNETFLLVCPEANGEGVLFREVSIITTGFHRLTYYINSKSFSSEKIKYAEIHTKLKNIIKINGKIISSLKELQNMYKPNRNKNFSWGNDYCVFTKEVFEKTFGLQAKIINF